MRRLILLFSLAISCAFQSQAQYIQIGPEVGVNFNKFLVDDALYDDDYDMRPGLKIGGIVDVGFSPMVSFQPGVFYSAKGTRWSYSEPYAPGVTNRVTRNVRINYLEIPLNLQLKFGHPRGAQFFIGAGPYIAFALNGEEEYRSTLRHQNGSYIGRDRQDYELELGDREDEDDYKGSDAGINLNMGIMGHRGFFVRGNIGFGMTNLIPGGHDDLSAKNFGVGLSVGYLFGN